MGRDDLGWRWELRYWGSRVRWGYLPMVVVSLGMVIWGTLGWPGAPR